ncbi:class I SAM-dependent methyltransferase [Dactylosporangium sp. NPDC050588]|uniref:class I SAM-dependent methyltransferase n=1 Tax=Dactylosporangium sp. NPDC050588 TaxID=3157211 RepID=UPI0033F841A0
MPPPAPTRGCAPDQARRAASTRPHAIPALQGMTERNLVMDLPRIFTIRESSHRIHNPLTADKLAALGASLHLAPGTRALDLASGSGEMLCTWARDHGITGTGLDISTVFTEQARSRAAELGVADRVEFIHGDAAGHVADQPVDLAACIGATWIGNGVAGTTELLDRSLRPGGLMLIGEPYWRQTPPDETTGKACHATSIAEFLLLPELIEQFQELGYDVVEMMLADQDSWDRYAAAQWLNLRRWLDQNPDDELAPEIREELTTEPARYARYGREYLSWGVFALMKR